MKELKKINADTMYSDLQDAGEYMVRGSCPFINRGAMAVSWKGDVSPCVPLMHSYSCYILGRKKRILRYIVGNITKESPLEIWKKEEYKAFVKGWPG